MTLTRSHVRNILFISLFSLFALTMVSYAIYQSRLFLLGPSLVITNPLNGETLQEPVVTLTGSAHRIARIYVNDRQIFTDENGVFEEQLLLLPGYNILTVRVDDRFGRTREKTLQLVVDEEAPTEEYLSTLRYESIITSTTTTATTTR